MTSKTAAAPASPSPEAQAFINDNLPLDIQPRTRETIAALRRDTLEAYRDGCERQRERHTQSVTDQAIAGVRVQQVLPKDQSGKRRDAALLYFFGGGHCQGSPFEDLRITAPLSHHLGLPIFVPHYRLAPEHPFPAALNDAWAVYRALAERFGADKLAIAGESAGGNLALALLLRARAAGHALPAAAALLSPWADLTGGGDSVTANAERDPSLYPEALHEAAALYAGDRPKDDPLVSPVYGRYDARFPPTLITTGTRDLLLSHATRMAQVLRQAGVDTRLHVWDGLWHVFEFYPELPESRQSIEEIAGFLERHLDASDS